jgi:hypothetical protein
LNAGAGVGRLGGEDPESGEKRELMAKNVLTKEIDLQVVLRRDRL